MAKPRQAQDARDPGTLDRLQAELGYRFQDPASLRLALTHRSFAYEVRPGVPQTDKAPEGKNPPGTDNEQLEFLGDAVLGLTTTELLYGEFPDRSEGELTRMRASLVSRDSMAALGFALGLDRALLLGHSVESNNGRHKPALLADATEAVIAAMYLDALRSTGEGLAPVRALLRRRLLEPALGRLQRALAQGMGRGALRDFKTLLQERVQAENAGKLVYMDVHEEGPPHDRRFTVEARLETTESSRVLAAAEGASKKEAQQGAAERALQAWPAASGATAHSSAPDAAETVREASA